MKILGIILQNKQGENIIIVTANDFSHELAYRYSSLIYNSIVQKIEKQKHQLDQSFQIDSSVLCVYKIMKEIIIEVLVTNQNLFLGHESIQKLQLYFNHDSRQESIMKKYSEIFLSLEEFLYTREINHQKLSLSNKNKFSSKKYADTEVYNKFLHVQQGLEKNLIANIPLKHSQKVQLNIEKQEEFIMASVNNLNITNKTIEAVQKNNNKEQYKNRVKQQRALNQHYAFNLKNNKKKQLQNKSLTSSSAKKPSQQQQLQQNNKNKPKQYMGISSEQILQLQEQNNNNLIQQSINDIFNQQQQANFTQNNNNKKQDNFQMDLLDLDFREFKAKPIKDQVVYQQQQKNDNNLNNNQNNFQMTQSVRVQPNRNRIFDQKINDNNNNGNMLQSVQVKRGSSFMQSSNSNQQQNNNNILDPSLQNYNYHEQQKQQFNSATQGNQNNNNNGSNSYLQQQMQVNKAQSLNNLDHQQQQQQILQQQQNNYLQQQQQGIQSQRVQPRGNSSQDIDLLDMGNDDDNNNQFQQQQQQQQELDRPKLKLMEKMVLQQLDSKIKEVKLYGQIAIEGQFREEVLQLDLIGENWVGQNAVNKRMTPNTIPIKEISQNKYKLKVEGKKFEHNKGLFDYIMPPNIYFNPNLIPIFFIYRQENHPSKPDVRFYFQYKMNEKWTGPISNVQIEVVFNDELIFGDIKQQPEANSFQNKTILWKTAQLTQNVKGKLALQIEQINKPFNEVLKYVKISFKTQHEIANLNANIVNQYSQILPAEKQLIVEYKILPNETKI